MSVPAVMSVTEDEGTVQVCATLDIQSYTTAVDIDVTLASSDGTGKTMFNSLLCVTVYYNGISMNLVFPAGSNSDTPPMCMDISIIDDPSTVETDETFTVTLSTSSSVVSLGNDMTVVTITNASSKYA